MQICSITFAYARRLDDFDLDDTLKTNKDPKGKTSLQNEKEDFGPPDSGGKYVGKKADSLNNLFEYEEHETSIGKHINPNNQKRDPIADELMAATSIDHNGSGRTQRGDPTSDRRRSLTFSSDDISQTKRTLSIHDSHEQTSMESDDCSSAKRRTSSYATSSANAAAAKIVSADEVADEKESLGDHCVYIALFFCCIPLVFGTSVTLTICDFHHLESHLLSAHFFGFFKVHTLILFR